RGGGILFPAHFNSLKPTSRKTCHSRTIRALLIQSNYNSNCVLTSACKNRFVLQNDMQLSALAESEFKTELLVTILLNMTDVELVLNNFKGTCTY
uniref:Uncharacterized protein n=1 Tax=Glossina palpalis gambiensis TaxID=67801 RepID=A0A1B0BR78_9MUSC